MFQIGTFAVSWEFSCSVPLLGKFGEILGTLQVHFKCSKFFSFPGMCLQCPQNFPKFSQKRYTAGTLPGHCKCTNLDHLWYIPLVLSKFPSLVHCDHTDGNTANEPLGNITGTFFGKPQGLPSVYLMGTPQSHDLEHCKCTGSF